ncbi:MAG: hypothetical protein JSV10_05880, partial [Candidatus Zixiibacteriota bacterium]
FPGDNSMESYTEPGQVLFSTLAEDPDLAEIVEMFVDEHDNVKYLTEFARYVGQGPASVCGLAFGPDGLYFTDLHGEVGFKKGEKSGGNVWRIAKTDKER